MYAFKGDQIVTGGGAGSPARRAEVLSGDHADGHPPFWVRWSDTGEETVWTPTAAAEVEHAGPTYPPEYEAHR